MQETKSLEGSAQDPPRIGIPYRRTKEEQAGDRIEIGAYATAVEEAGGEPRLVSLLLSPAELERLTDDLDGIVLPGSPADVDPARYGERARPETAAADDRREQTDWALLDWAFAGRKPVLAICYGTQLLNVYLGGTLVQEIAGELRGSLNHSWEKKKGLPEPHHPALLVPGSLVSRLAGAAETVINSSHHQSIRMPGHNLRVTAKSPDGVIEAVELEDPAHWVVGAQWHPERQRNEAAGEEDSGRRLARALFEDLVRASREARAGGRRSGKAARARSEAEAG